MGGVPVKHHTHGKVGRRRSHLALKKSNLFPCSVCGSLKLPHQACQNCGQYKKRTVIDVFSKLSKKERKEKEKELAKSKESGHK